MAVGDIYQVNLQAILSPTNIIHQNTFYYQQAVALPDGDGGTDDLDKKNARALLNRFNEVVVDAMRVPVSPLMTFVKLDAYSLYDDLDASSLVISKAGQNGGIGELLPTFNTARFILETASRRRGGSKFLGGHGEAASTGNTWLPAHVTSLSNIAVQMGATLRAAYAGLGNDVEDAFRPVVVRRIKTATGYRLPQNAAEARADVVVAVLVSTLITTMNTRKR